MSDHGTTTWQGDRATVHFERWIDAAIDEVWSAATTDVGLATWLAPAKVDLRDGGSIDLDFDEGGLAGGAILELVPGSVIEFEWGFPGEPDSVLRIELASSKDGTRVTLNHRLLPGNQVVGYGAGWHAHLDQLGEVTSGQPASDWNTRFAELLPLYQKGDVEAPLPEAAS